MFMKLSLSEAMKRADILRTEIDRHRYAYHVLDQPSISDEAYDALYRELEDIERIYPALIVVESPTQRVGAEPLAGFEKVRHAVAQWSFDDIFDFEELRAWDVKIRKMLMNGGLIRESEMIEYRAEDAHPIRLETPRTKPAPVASSGPTPGLRECRRPYPCLSPPSRKGYGE